MSPTGMQARVGAALVAGALLLGCGPSQEAAAPAERGPAFFAAAMQNLEKAPDLVRQEVLETCGKWHHLDLSCDEEQVRRDQLECWIDHGEGTLKLAETHDWRPRARYQRALLEVNLCMEMRRWRKVKPGRDF